mgnify:CR=1 FL=1
MFYYEYIANLRKQNPTITPEEIALKDAKPIHGVRLVFYGLLVAKKLQEDK